MIQAILYDTSTGRIRQVLDPEDERGEVASLLNPEPHEAVLTREKTGSDRYHEWQEFVSRHTGLMPADLHPEIKEYVHSRVSGVTET